MSSSGAAVKQLRDKPRKRRVKVEPSPVSVPVDVVEHAPAPAPVDVVEPAPAPVDVVEPTQEPAVVRRKQPKQTGEDKVKAAPKPLAVSPITEASGLCFTVPKVKSLVLSPLDRRVKSALNTLKQVNVEEFSYSDITDVDRVLYEELLDQFLVEIKTLHMRTKWKELSDDDKKAFSVARKTFQDSLQHPDNEEFFYYLVYGLDKKLYVRFVEEQYPQLLTDFSMVDMQSKTGKELVDMLKSVLSSSKTRFNSDALLVLTIYVEYMTRTLVLDFLRTRGESTKINYTDFLDYVDTSPYKSLYHRTESIRVSQELLMGEEKMSETVMVQNAIRSVHKSDVLVKQVSTHFKHSVDEVFKLLRLSEDSPVVVVSNSLKIGVSSLVYEFVSSLESNLCIDSYYNRTRTFTPPVVLSIIEQQLCSSGLEGLVPEFRNFLQDKLVKSHVFRQERRETRAKSKAEAEVSQ